MRRVALASMLSLSLLACRDAAPVGPLRLTLAPSSVVCALGERVPLQATVEGGHAAVALTVTGTAAWIVDPHPERGSATLVCEAAGTDVVVADGGGARAAAPIEVRAPAPGAVQLTLAPAAVTLVNGTAVTLDARVITSLPDAALDVRFASSDTTVANVDSIFGTVRAVGAGTTTITAVARADRRVSATTIVTVTRGSDLANGISVSPGLMTLALGQSAPITALVQLARTAPPNTSRVAIYASSDPAVATVSATGIVRAVGQGSATITIAPAVAPLLRARIAVTVYVAPP